MRLVRYACAPGLVGMAPPVSKIDQLIDQRTPQNVPCLTYTIVSISCASFVLEWFDVDVTSF